MRRINCRPRKERLLLACYSNHFRKCASHSSHLFRNPAEFRIPSLKHRTDIQNKCLNSVNSKLYKMILVFCVSTCAPETIDVEHIAHAIRWLPNLFAIFSLDSWWDCRRKIEKAKIPHFYLHFCFCTPNAATFRGYFSLGVFVLEFNRAHCLQLSA